MRIAAVLLVLAACDGKSPGWRVRAVTDTGSLALERPSTTAYATLIDVDWPPEPMPTAHHAALEAQRLASAAKRIEVVWQTDARSGLARVTLDGADLAETLIALGLARATRGADQRLRDAEAQAWAAQRGGWGEHRGEILRWLRGRALELSADSGDVDIATWRDTSWQLAATYEAASLAFFAISPGDELPSPPCVDRLAVAIAPTLRPATVADVTRAFADGQTLVEVPASGRTRCEVWTVDDAKLARRDADGSYTRSFALVAGFQRVDWTGYRDLPALPGDEGPRSGSSRGLTTVTAASDDALLIGGSPWFTSAVACERALKTAFPDGCEEP